MSKLIMTVDDPASVRQTVGFTLKEAGKPFRSKQPLSVAKKVLG